MILTEGDFFWMDDGLEPQQSGHYHGRTVWMMRRVASLEEATTVRRNATEDDGSSSRSGRHSDLLDISDVMDVLRMGKSWTYNRIKDGDIPSLRIGGSIKVRREDLERWIEEQRV